ncbi:glycosyltransferase family 2 protein [Ruegeria sp. 2205SS24-7]|uniref:glycosyltransferase family 2 protein n=1 Tax=Ruegeria discodermiae TaxID=3064389 RepID=UPI0027412204|nr:glycosyltransferase family 2 protein [Ruegeria sp. 2205SS24-7]MDP5219426.1 glycosyltransferase family 2 protein [Ruegeria sp. 2205SS24-7]
MARVVTSDPRRAIGWTDAYRLRWKRRRLLWRSLRSRHHLRALADRTKKIKPDDILLVATMRNEITRLPHFLDYYRTLGINHFLIVDNDSDDGTTGLLRDQPDVSLWHTDAPYRDARFGLDWVTWLQMRYAHGHWVLMADADELLVFAHCDQRDLRDLTGWLDAQNRRVFGALMLDLYPQGPIGAQDYNPGANPLEVVNGFDPDPYRGQWQQPLGNLWVQGGARERVFFADRPERSPTLNKIPLIRWSRRYAYVNSCHSILPRDLNFAYDGPGGTAPSGVLLHTKFLPEILPKSAIEQRRGQHFTHPEEFGTYYDRIASAPTLWGSQTQRYEGWQQLQRLGLLSGGGWEGL